MRFLWVLAMAVLCTTEGFADMPAVGDQAPAFAGTKHDGKTLGLSDYEGQWLAIYFYPKSDTPGCTKQACSLRDGISALEDEGLNVLGVSVNSVADQAKFREKYNLNFPLLADEEAEVTEAFGVKRGILPMSRRITFLITPEAKIGAIIESIDVNDHANQILTVYKGLAAGE